jgi:hypothetical protein
MKLIPWPCYYSDYIHLDLEDDDFWDREFGEARNKKRSRRVAAPIREKVPGGRRGIDRESIIAKYKIMQVRVQDRNGNYFMVKKKVRFVLLTHAYMNCH